MELRPYQTEVVEEFHRLSERGRCIILVAPTGSGKTVIASAIINTYVARHEEVLVLAHRREIIGQTSAKLRSLGIWHGIILAGEKTQPMAPVQLASVQSFWSRALRKGPNGKSAMELPPAKLVVIDEAHHTPAKTWRKILESYADATVLGLTATPCRGDGRGLGGIFEVMIQCPQVAELISLGHLVRTRVYAPSAPDLAGIQVRGGDYVESQLAHRMDRPKLVADIVTTWHKHGEHRKTVCFATGVGHSVHLRDEFVRSGVRAEHVDGDTPPDERDATLARLAAGELDVVTNCMVLTEGWDMPEVGCCILARPTKQMGLYRQMIGRVLRPAPGKTDAIVLDHAGAVFQHGLPEDRVYWTLDPDKKAVSPDHGSRSSIHGPKIVECSQCSALRQAGEPCPHCGFMPVAKPKLVMVKDGDLALVNNGRPSMPQVNRREWHAMLCAFAAEHGYKPGWAAHKYREKFGYWPPFLSQHVKHVEPNAEVRAWVRSRQIALAKSRQGASS